ncbi:MAG: agmatinase family protein [Flavobacteriales bacterium]
MSEFDPNGVGIANGNIFGFPYNESEARIVIVPIPWDATASYGKGTSDGPESILEASTQLDFYHPDLERAYDTKVYMSPISQEWKEINRHCCEQGMEYIQYLETHGEEKALEKFQGVLDEINEAHQALRSNLKERSLDLIRQGKIPAVLGGEHSTPLGLIEALNETYNEFGVLQIDAHADLRDAYEGFEQSHASIMFNVLKEAKNMSKLVQVGIRDVSEREVFLSRDSDRVQTYYDWQIKNEQYKGRTWADQVAEMIEHLPSNVYVSFDIDGLKPELCPHTGTPVAGGFELQEVSYLLFALVDSGRKIIGFDLNEVAPGSEGDWDANVGARALWQLVCACEKSRRNHEKE